MRLLLVVAMLLGADLVVGLEQVNAQERIAVAGPQGLGSTRLRERVETVFRNDRRFDLVSPDEVRQTRRSQNLGPRGLARALETWVVAGSSRRENRQFQTTLVLYDQEGTRRGRVKLRGRRMGVIMQQLGNGTRRLWRRGSRNAARAGAAEAAEAEALDAPAADEEDEPESLPEPALMPSEAEALEHVGSVEAPLEEADDADLPEEFAPDMSRQVAMRVGARFGFIHRQMRTTAMVNPEARGTTGGSLEEPRNYEVPGIGQGQVGIDFEFYPGAIFANQTNSWLGARFHLAGAPWLQSTAPACTGNERCPESDSVMIGTRQREIYGGLIGRLPFGAHSASVELGYGQNSFQFDREALGQVDPSRVVPSVKHSFFRIGLEGQFALVPRRLEVEVRAAYLVGTGIGNEAKEMWGSRSQSLGGIDAGISLRSELGGRVSGLTLEVYADVSLFRTRFRGQTMCPANETDCDSPGSLWEAWPAADGPRGEQVTGGVQDDVRDRFVTFGLAVGYTWRGIGSRPNRPASPDAESDSEVDSDVEVEAEPEPEVAAPSSSLPPAVYVEEEAPSNGSSLPPAIY